MSKLRTVLAQNASPMTLDGTRTYIVGSNCSVVIDPGPLLGDHVDAVAAQVGSGVVVSILLTHNHPDHSEAAEALAARLHASVAETSDGQWFDTDAGRLQAIHTPGHTPDHFAFHWPAERAVFCGDLMMGGLDTALVARPEGDLHQYLSSLETLRALHTDIIYPAHGPAFDDPAAAIDRYVQHRMLRVRQVLDALRGGPLHADALIDMVYGHELEPVLRAYAASAVEAYLHFLLARGEVRPSGSGIWSLA